MLCLFFVVAVLFICVCALCLCYYLVNQIVVEGLQLKKVLNNKERSTNREEDSNRSVWYYISSVRFDRLWWL